MTPAVFISYARGASAGPAQALAAKLGELAFLDTARIDDGQEFPPCLLSGLLDARVVVIFATRTYAERSFCRLELRLALARADGATDHLVVAIGEGVDAVLDALPTAVARRHWPAADATEQLEALVRDRLGRQSASLRELFSEAEARRLAVAFLEESNVPEPQPLHGIVCSLPQGVGGQSIGSRFTGRVDELRRIHEMLWDGCGGGVRLTSRITGGAGFGKTRLVTEYLHRYGPRYYPGGVFWVNADAESLDAEFCRVLRALDASVPDLHAMRKQKRSIRGELEAALRRIAQPALYVIDNILEATRGAEPLPVGDFCPALGAVTVLATSRQDTREEGVRTICVDTLQRDAAILLLTDNITGAGSLSWAQWGEIAEWVGDLPVALDLLNRCLALGSIRPQELLDRVKGRSLASAAAELDELRDALKLQVPSSAALGIAEAFYLSFARLDDLSQVTAILLAQFAPAPLPTALFDALPPDCTTPAVRAALRSRHFVTYGDNTSFGAMHRLVAESLRRRAGGWSQEAAALALLSIARVFPIPGDNDLERRMCADFLPHALAVLERVPHAITGLDDEGWLAHRRAQLQQRVQSYQDRVGASEDAKETMHAIMHYAEDQRAATFLAKRFSEFKTEIKTRIMRIAFEAPENRNLQPIRDALQRQPLAFRDEIQRVVGEANELVTKLRHLLTMEASAANDEAITNLVADRVEQFPIILQLDLDSAYGKSTNERKEGIIEHMMAMRHRDEARARVRRALDIPEAAMPQPKPKKKRWWPWSRNG